MKKGSKKPVIKTKPKEAKKTDNNYYTEEEIKLLDKFHAQTEKKFEDDEIYELMLKYKNDEEAILSDLKEQLKERKRGEEFNWQTIGKSKILFNYLYFNYRGKTKN